MKQFELIENFQGISANTMFFGPYAIEGGGTGYYQKENIPAQGTFGGLQCFFSSAVENSTLFKEVVNQETKPA